MIQPKEKAKQIIDRFDFEVRDLDNEISHTKWESKQCDLICVDEIIKTFKFPKYDGNPDFEANGDELYWLEVKREVKLL